jgi:hypothetical protein
MTLKLVEGFDYYGTGLDGMANLLRRWRSTTPGLAAVAGGRIALGLSLDVGSHATRDLLDDETAFVLGFAWYHAGALTGGGEIVRLLDATPDPVSHVPADLPHLTLAYDADGFFTLYRGDSDTGTLLASSDPYTLGGEGTFQYIEIKVTLGAAGSCLVRIDGTDEAIDFSGSTLGAGAPVVNGISFRGAATTGISYCDDVYLLSQDGTYNSDLLGDVKVRMIRPTAVGLLSGGPWTAAPYTDDTTVWWQRVADQVPDDETTFLQTSSAALDGVISNFFMEDIPSADVVHGVEVVALARKLDAAATTTFQTTLRVHEGFDEFSPISPAVDLSVAWRYVGGIYEEDPVDSTQLNTADVNGHSGGPTPPRLFQPGISSGLPHTTGAILYVTQVVTQILVTGIGSTAEIRITQYPIETLLAVADADRITDVTQVAIEVAVAPSGTARSARVSQVAVEAMVAPGITVRPVRVTQVAVEVLIFLNGSEPTPTPRAPSSQAQIAG